MSKFVTFFVVIMLSLFMVMSVLAQSVPPAPTNLTVEQMMSNAKLQWTGSAGASGYKIYKSIDGLPFNHVVTVHSTNFVDVAVSSGHVYRYYTTAYNYIGESEPSNDVVFTFDAPPPARIRGLISGNIVDDSTGFPINGVRLRFYKTDGFLYFREARTDSLGYYSIHIDTGAYYIYASKWTFKPEWYDDAETRELATLVPVVSKDTSTANFGLTRLVPPLPPRLVSVSGTVIDSGTGSPIKDAFVVIMRSTRQIHLIQNQEGNLFGNRNETFMIPGFGTLIGVMRVVKTDESGNYQAFVPDSLNYIMLAVKLGYIPEFYNNKLTPYDADRLFIVANTTGINFDLVLNPNAQNSVAGSVKNTTNDGIFSKVVLFEKTTLGVFPVRCMVTDTFGNFSFNYLFTGFYYAKAYPFIGYAPAWYNTDSCGIACWVKADSFYVEGAAAGIDICVQPLVLGGFASIGGKVMESIDGTEMQGVTVYAISTVSNTVTAYDITEDDGKFEIQNLAPGSYKIIVDKEGYTSSEAPVYFVDATNNYTVVNTELSLTSTTLDLKEINNSVPVKYSLRQNYPNPFNPSTEIGFSVPVVSHVTLSVYNVLGQTVAILFDNEVNAGSYSVPWNGTDVSGSMVGSGMYFYKISVSSADHQHQFTSVRKMVLLK